MQNIELKVFADDHKKIISLLKKNGAEDRGVLRQTDTYFNCVAGRLKMREINGKEAELIYYERPDSDGKKLSNYEVVKMDKKTAKELSGALTMAYGAKVVVKKSRNLWIYKNTRVHLDTVQGLGKFLELETVVRRSVELGKKEYDEVVKILKLDNYKKYKKSYSDMLLEKKG